MARRKGRAKTRTFRSYRKAGRIIRIAAKSACMARLLAYARRAAKRGILEPRPFNVYDWPNPYTSRQPMRTNIDIDDELLAQAMRIAGKAT